MKLMVKGQEAEKGMEVTTFRNEKCILTDWRAPGETCGGASGKVYCKMENSDNTYEWYPSVISGVFVPADEFNAEVTMEGYTDYCTCFYMSEERKVYFYDEINERVIKTEKAQNQDEAIAIMQKWLDNAPDNIICQSLDIKHLKNVKCSYEACLTCMQKDCWTGQIARNQGLDAYNAHLKMLDGEEIQLMN